MGNLFSLDQAINFKGAAVEVIPLSSGPSLVLAEIIPQVQWRPGKEAGQFRGSGSGCPQDTLQIVRAVWAGGVEKANGEELGDSERILYQVTLT